MSPLIIDSGQVSVDSVIDVAIRGQLVELSNHDDFVSLIQKSRSHFDRLLKEEKKIYGVTTGFGDSVTTEVDPKLFDQLPLNLIRFHNCGMGDFFNSIESRAIQFVRLISLSKGYSGVRLDVLKQIETQLKHQIYPQIPKEGSVGASGDLTPLSYLASTLIGEGKVVFEGKVTSSQLVYEKLGIHPIQLKAKEGLALMNGTSVMTALACLALHRSKYLVELASRITSLMCVGSKGNKFHFDDRLFQAKPHPGSIAVARMIREDLNGGYEAGSSRIQDRYSLRCAPHVVGVLADCLEHFSKMVEIELNSSNDNPLVDPETGEILHGGNFYGGHIAHVMDSLKINVANVADLIDRQIALIVDPKSNNGLSPNLSGAKGALRSVSHGFKAVQIAASAWTAEALSLTMPVSAFSRSTECHNQDKVSMGTISARQCIRVLDLVDQVCAAGLRVAQQAIQLRIESGEIEIKNLSANHRKHLSDLESEFSFLESDRPLDNELRQVVQNIQDQRWGLYET